MADGKSFADHLKDSTAVTAPEPAGAITGSSGTTPTVDPQTAVAAQSGPPSPPNKAAGTAAYKQVQGGDDTPAPGSTLNTSA